ncbi:MAG TPA: AAA family ATPase [Candidatus Eisenbacteria bacterium]|nr:AAA family ATPase [Candidatus Eisenbacteria bacterium]
MYEEYFGFREPPFRITPDPRFLYRNPSVEEAAAALSYGIERRKGFLSLVGEAGTGKTTLLRHVLDTLAGNVKTVLLLHPTVEFDEILEYLLSELGIPVDGGRKLVLLQRLQDYLLEHTRAGGNLALLIDEAQDLAPHVLEELRLLSNLETGTEKILQIVLAGQPELEAKLADPALRQLRQRIALHIRLRPFSAAEVAAYISRRLELAGATRADIFAPAAIRRIATVSHGIPRIINVLCDASLVTAFATSGRQVSADIVDEAWADYARLGVQVPEEKPLVAPPSPSPAPPTSPLLPPTPGPVEPEPAPPPVHVIASPPASPPPLVDVKPPDEKPLEPLVINIGGGAARSWLAGVPVRNFVGGFLVAVLAILGVYTMRTRPASTALPEEPVVLGPPTAAEARAVVHEYMLAYEDRDLDRMMALFAPQAIANEIDGADAIREDYAKTFARLAEVTCVVPRVDVTLSDEDDIVTVSGPLVIDYRDNNGETSALRGDARWEIARLGGAPRIVGLRYTLGDAS